MPDLDVTRRVPIDVGTIQNVNLTLAGCGGTGSFLTLHLARLAYHARQLGIDLHLTLVDPDHVEEKNVGRQNFVPAEIGRPKAEALAARYGFAFGLAIRFYSEPIADRHVDRDHRFRDGWLHLVVGAVDNTAARRDIEAIAKSWRGRLWWLDCGNHDASGQVLLGNEAIEQPEINPMGFCNQVPLPSVQHPELVAEKPALTGCADDALAGIQSLMVNQAVAGWAASYLHRFVVAGDLDACATYFDLRAGSARSQYIQENGR